VNQVPGRVQAQAHATILAMGGTAIKQSVLEVRSREVDGRTVMQKDIEWENLEELKSNGSQTHHRFNSNQANSGKC
jgi:hypothetical protein